jgi:uncharacterized membrane protein
MANIQDDDTLKKICQFDYLLHIAGMVFSFGLVTLVALFLNYMKRGDAAGTIYASHMQYMISAWWKWLIWTVILGVILFVLGVITLGIGFFVLGWIMALPAIWFVYKMVIGLLALQNGRSVS